LNVEQEVTDLFDSLPSCPANIPVLPTSKWSFEVCIFPIS
jgi:hypothetical protein